MYSISSAPLSLKHSKVWANYILHSHSTQPAPRVWVGVCVCVARQARQQTVAIILAGITQLPTRANRLTFVHRFSQSLISLLAKVWVAGSFQVGMGGASRSELQRACMYAMMWHVKRLCSYSTHHNKTETKQWLSQTKNDDPVYSIWSANRLTWKQRAGFLIKVLVCDIIWSLHTIWFVVLLHTYNKDLQWHFDIWFFPLFCPLSILTLSLVAMVSCFKPCRDSPWLVTVPSKKWFTQMHTDRQQCLLSKNAGPASFSDTLTSV